MIITHPLTDKILILDFGSQYTQLIARRVRENRVYSEIFPFNATLDKIRAFGPKGIILSGGPSSVYDKNAPICDLGIFKLGIPVLGICYGMQLMAHTLGGQVSRAAKREYGRAMLSVDDAAGLFRGLTDCTKVWMSHGDRIEKMPEGFGSIGHTDNSPVAAMAKKEQKFFAIQFHPEVAHTDEGMRILRNFVFEISGCKPTWEMASFIEWSIADIRSRVGGKKVICALSGGVDSAVAAYLIHKAIGKNLVCMHIDNGLMRKNESREIVHYFKKKLNLRFIDATDIFLSRLSGVADPERKRKIIGKTFIDVFQKYAKSIGSVKYLIQGTLYPDVIESSSFQGPSVTIKSHHNVGGLPDSLHMELIEPFRELFKDEVREIGRILKVPDLILNRHPFPGPGLAVRILGAITKDKLELLREADYIYIDALKRHGLYDKIWQAFSVLLPVSTVGVMGDSRTYEKVIALRAVGSVDGMTANWFHMPIDLLEEVSTGITNKVRGINRVVYDISNKPPSTIEWE